MSNDDDPLVVTNGDGSPRSDSPMPSWMVEHNTPYKSRDEVSNPYSILSSDNDEAPESKQPPAGAIDASPFRVPAPAGISNSTGDHQNRKEDGPVLVPVVRSELPVMLPDKLPRSKVLVELEPSGHQATDLSGDAGAVGRFIVSGKPGSEEVRMDLKGTVYRCRILPLAGSIAVVNIGADSAKIETLVTDYIRLEEESHFYEAEAMLEGTAMDLLGGDDDENYRPTALEVGATTGAGPSTSAHASAKPGAKAKAKGALQAKSRPMKKGGGAAGSKAKGKGPAKQRSAKPPPPKSATARKKGAGKGKES